MRYAPAAHEAQVGGDWYDAFLAPDGATTLVIGDTAGHDRTAATGMAQIRNVLRGVAHTLAEPPAAVLSALDHALRGLGIDTLASAVLAQVEQTPEQTSEQARQGLRTLRWSNAGHPPPLLLHPDGTAVLLEREPDLLLGLDPDTPRADHTVELQPGATLVLYTDGLVERRDQPLETGLARLQDAAASLAHLPLEQVCDALLAALPAAGEDDIALLAVRARPLE